MIPDLLLPFPFLSHILSLSVFRMLCRAHRHAPVLGYNFVSPTRRIVAAHTPITSSSLNPAAIMSSANGASSSSSSYSTRVSRIPGRSSIPEEAVSNPHHVMKHGTRKGFKNPYPSCGVPPSPALMLTRVVWYGAVPLTSSDLFSSPA